MNDVRQSFRVCDNSLTLNSMNADSWTSVTVGRGTTFKGRSILMWRKRTWQRAWKLEAAETCSVELWPASLETVVPDIRRNIVHFCIAISVDMPPSIRVSLSSHSGRVVGNMELKCHGRIEFFVVCVLESNRVLIRTVI